MWLLFPDQPTQDIEEAEDGMGRHPLTVGKRGNGMVGPIDIGAAVYEIDFTTHSFSSYLMASICSRDLAACAAISGSTVIWFLTLPAARLSRSQSRLTG